MAAQWHLMKCGDLGAAIAARVGPAGRTFLPVDHPQNRLLKPVHMIQEPIDDEVQVFVFEGFDAIHASNGARFCELALVAEDVVHVLFAEAFLADALVVQAEVRKVAARHVHEAPAMVGEPRVILAIHAVSKSIIEKMPLGDGGFPPVETGGGSDVTSLLDKNTLIEACGLHVANELPAAIDVIPAAIDHIRLWVFFCKFLHRF